MISHGSSFCIFIYWIMVKGHRGRTKIYPLKHTVPARMQCSSLLKMMNDTWLKSAESYILHVLVIIRTIYPARVLFSPIYKMFNPFYKLLSGTLIWMAVNPEFTTGARAFAVCQRHTAKSLLCNTRQVPTASKHRQRRPLPCVFYRAHGKVFAVCKSWYSAKKRDLTAADGKRLLCRVPWR